MSDAEQPRDRFSDIQGKSDPLGDLDFEKLIRVIKKSVFWILGVFVVINATTFLWIRYTKPVYKSTAELKLDIKSEASILGLTSVPGGESTEKLSGEIELLKSNLFMSRLREAINLEVSYYNEGKFLSEEQYNSSPIDATISHLNPSLYDSEIYFENIDNKHYQLKYVLSEKEVVLDGTYGKLIHDDNIGVLIAQNQKRINDQIYKPFFFRVNSDAAIGRYLKKNFSVTVKNINAKIIEVGFTDKNKYKARDIIAAVDTLYQKQTKESKNIAIDQQIAFLDNQLLEVEENIENYEEYFEDFIVDNKTLDLNQDLGFTIQKLNKLDSTRFNLREQIEQIKRLRSGIKKKAPLKESSITYNKLPPAIVNKVTEFLIAEKSYKNLLRSYNENTLAAIKIKEEQSLLTIEINTLLKEYENRLEKALAQANKNQIEIERSFTRLPSMRTSFDKNRRFYSLQEEVYFNLIAKKNELEITKAGTVANMTVLSPASLDGKPVAPNTIMIYLGGLIGSFIVSLVFIAVRYLLNNTISSRSELEKLISTPLVGVIPLYKKEKLHNTRLVINKNPKSAISEALRSIRTNLEFFTNDSTSRVISVTSTLSGEGKTFVAVNLGAIIALSKLKVVVVDLDMRKPKVHLAFGSENDFEGVSTVLSGRTELSSVICASKEVENLYFIKAGTTPPNPSELMYSEDFRKMLEELKSKFDVIIFDTPPIGLVTDGVLAMKKSDTSLYVFKSDYSKRSFVKSFNQAVRQNDFKNIGVILNGLDLSNGGAYGYGLGYGYGYGYYEESEV